MGEPKYIATLTPEDCKLIHASEFKHREDMDSIAIIDGALVASNGVLLVRKNTSASSISREVIDRLIDSEREPVYIPGEAIKSIRRTGAQVFVDEESIYLKMPTQTVKLSKKVAYGGLKNFKKLFPSTPKQVVLTIDTTHLKRLLSCLPGPGSGHLRLKIALRPNPVETEPKREKSEPFEGRTIFYSDEIREEIKETIKRVTEVTPPTPPSPQEVELPIEFSCEGVQGLLMPVRNADYEYEKE